MKKQINELAFNDAPRVSSGTHHFTVLFFNEVGAANDCIWDESI